MDQESLGSALSSLVSNSGGPLSPFVAPAAPDSNVEALMNRLAEETRMTFHDNSSESGNLGDGSASAANNFAAPYPAGPSSSGPASEVPSIAASIDEDSQASKSSVVSSGSARKRKVNGGGDDDTQGSSKGSSQTPGAANVDISYPAERIYEYQWPEGSGEYFVVQEQISEYLGIKSFKRKYPDFFRRALDFEERIHLKDHGVVDTLHSDLGLTALRSEDVMELMAKEYPSKYCEYLAAIETRHQAAYSKNVVTGYQQPTVDKSKMGEFIRKTIKSVSEYNQQINQERKDERRACMDLQTYIVHYPIGLGKENLQLINNIKKGRVKKQTRYPISLVPGQYQDWYMKYTTDELKYFPLNTVLYGPIVTDPSKLPPLLTSAEESSPESDSDDSAMSDDDGHSCCSSKDGNVQGDTTNNATGDIRGASAANMSTPTGARRPKRGRRDATQPSDSSSSDSSSSDSDGELGPPPAPTLMKEFQYIRPDAICKFCKGTRLYNKAHVPEELVHCSDCAYSSHPGCLELTSEMVDVIRSYPWQCSDCKACVHCSKAHEEDKMMFCDKCDRGYHTFCVGLKTIPTGKWVCTLCAQCAQCGVTTPAPGYDSTAKNAAQWQHETIKIISPNGDALRRHQLLCVACYKQRRK